MRKKSFLSFLTRVSILSVFLFLFAQFQSVLAATYTVDTVNDSHDVTPGDGMCSDVDGLCSVRAAIEEANAQAGPDIITLPAGTYTLTLGSQLYLTSEITINGEGVATTIIQANQNPNTATYRVMELSIAGNVTLTGVTIRHGKCDGLCPTVSNYGGGIYNAGTLIIDNVTVSDNIVTTYASAGGGIFSSGTLTVRNGSFIGKAGHGNIGTGGAGGIFNRGVVTVDNSTISANSALNPGSSGGGIYNEGGVVNVQNRSLIGGEGSGNRVVSIAGGGGIFNINGGTTTIDNSTISANFADYLGGGIYNDPSSTLIVRNGSVIGELNAGNTAADGGGIINYGVATIDASTINFNSSTGTENEGFGGGGILNAGILTIRNGSTIGGISSGNVAARMGGGIFNWTSGTVNITDSRILSNTAADNGGGIHNQSGGIVSVTGSCVVGNSATAFNSLNPAVQVATGNWWGDPSGPGGAGPGSGDTISTGWDFSGFLTSEPASCQSPNPTPTPTPTPYPFGGFMPPVDELPVLNELRAGAAVPVRFSLGGFQGFDIFASGYPKSERIECDSTQPVSGIEETVAAGNSGLTYDSTTDQYTYVWKTDKAWANTCRQFVMILNDTSAHRANFYFK